MAANSDAANVRDPACVETWPECEEGAYDPRCCRFPKSCSCTVYDEPTAATERDEWTYSEEAVHPRDPIRGVTWELRPGVVVWSFSGTVAESGSWSLPHD